MAFIDRTPQEKFFSELTAEQSELIVAPHIEKFREKEKKNIGLFDYHTTEEAKRRLTNKSIRLCIKNPELHDHPNSKMIENHMLYEVLPNYLDESNWFMMSCRMEKVEVLKARMRDKDTQFEIMNRIVDAKDTSRYRKTHNYTVTFEKKGRLCDEEFFPEGMIKAIGKNKKIFCHDEVHHWSPNIFNMFLNKTKPEVFIFTVVYPPELLKGIKNSLNREFYDFEVEGDNMFFFPDGRKGASHYAQPSDMKWLFTCNAWKTNDGVYTVKLIESKFAHHLFMVIKGQQIQEKKRYFSDFDSLDLTTLMENNVLIEDYPDIKYDHWAKLYQYIISLKKPDEASGNAFYRQKLQENIDVQKSIFMKKMIKTILAVEHKDAYGEGLIGKIIHDVRGRLPSWINKCLPNFDFDNFNRFLLTCKVLSISIKCRPSSIEDHIKLEFIDYESNDVVERKRTPYSYTEGVNWGTFTDLHIAIRKFEENLRIRERELRIYNDGGYWDRYDGGMIQWTEEWENEAKQKRSKSYTKKGLQHFILSYCEVGFWENIHSDLTVNRKPLGAMIHNYSGNFLAYVPKYHESKTRINIQSSGYALGECIKGKPIKVIHYHNLLLEPIELEFEIKEGHFYILIQFGFKTKAAIKDSDIVDIDEIEEEEKGPMDLPEVNTPDEKTKSEIEDNYGDNDEKQDICTAFLASANNCLFNAVAKELDIDPIELFMEAVSKSKYWADWVIIDKGAKLSDIERLSSDIDIHTYLRKDGEIIEYNRKSENIVNITWLDEHIFSSKEDMSYTGENKVYRANLDRAENLKRSFEGGLTGAKNGDQYTKLFENYELKQTNMNVKFVLGTAGSGKTRGILEEITDLACRSYKIMIISPRRNLANDWINKIQERHDPTLNKNILINTFENALFCKPEKYNLIVFDETPLFPNGYVDLVTSMYNIKKTSQGEEVGTNMDGIIVIGDPCQTSYYNKNDNGVISEYNDLTHLLTQFNAPEKYIRNSYRLCEKFYEGRFTGLDPISKNGNFKNSEPIIMNKISDLEECVKNKKYNVILTPSFTVKETLSYLEKKYPASGVKVMTFGESQGLTVNSGCVVMDPDGLKQSNNGWFTALTRCVSRVDFLNISAYQNNDYISKSCSTLKKFLKRTDRDEWAENIIKELNLTEVRSDFAGSLVGINAIHLKKDKSVDEVDREERLSGDPWLKSEINLQQRVNMQEVMDGLLNELEPLIMTHIPLCPENYGTVINFDNIKSKFDREMKTATDITDQFIDQKRANSKVFHNQCMLYESIYPRHKMSDSLTFAWAVKKRILKSSPEKEYKKLIKATPSGKILFNILKEKLNLAKPSESTKKSIFSEMVNEFEKKKLQKSQSTIANHSERSMFDWHWLHVHIFGKNQTCTKFEKQFCDAKAAQTIACFSHRVLTYFAPYCRYMEKLFTSNLPENIYIHNGKNFNCLSAWAKKYFKRNGICIESDYEAFDVSQDAIVLAFEIEFMKFYDIPQDVINDYIYMKINLGSKLGKLAIMRFTGEFCTFFFNTIVNIAFTFAKYNVDASFPMAFAGDDMVILRLAKEIATYRGLLSKMALKAKVQRTTRPLFCGWRLTEHGIYKEPKLVYDRFMIAKERDNMRDCINSYALECAQGYLLGDNLHSVMDEGQFFYHQMNIRLIIKSKNMLHTSIMQIFTEEIISDKLSAVLGGLNSEHNSSA